MFEGPLPPVKQDIFTPLLKLHIAQKSYSNFSYNTRKGPKFLAVYIQASPYLRAQILESEYLKSNPGFAT